MKHINVALFAVHAGCPHKCTFCDQKSISGCQKKLTSEDVHRAAQIALGGKNDVSGGEIAFFGGSFTLIDRGEMLSLLTAAREHVERGEFSGIRLSTRPDGIDEEICRILKENRVTAVELGAQSMDDRVLELNRRGHTAKQAEEASLMLKAHGFELGLQMMTGLYGSCDDDSIETAKKIISLSPQTVRIYPTVVMKNTELARLYEQGLYTPQSVEQAAELGSILLPMFSENGIKVIRFGLHSGGGVEGDYLAGAWHPALRELAESRIYLKNILSAAGGRKGKAAVFVAPNALSKAVGQKRQNIAELEKSGLICTVKPQSGLEEWQVILQFENDDN